MTNVEAFVNIARKCDFVEPHPERLVGSKTRRATQYPLDVVQQLDASLGEARLAQGTFAKPAAHNRVRFEQPQPQSAAHIWREAVKQVGEPGDITDLKGLKAFGLQRANLLDVQRG